MLSIFVTLFFVGSTMAQLTILHACSSISCSEYGPPICGTQVGAASARSYRVFASDCQRQIYNCVTGTNYVATDFELCMRYACPIRCDPNCKLDILNEGKICANYGRRYLVFRTLCEYLNFTCREGDVWVRTHMEVCKAHGAPEYSSSEADIEA